MNPQAGRYHQEINLVCNNLSSGRFCARMKAFSYNKLVQITKRPDGFNGEKLLQDILLILKLQVRTNIIEIYPKLTDKNEFKAIWVI